jgi:hypothetical protein
MTNNLGMICIQHDSINIMSRTPSGINYWPASIAFSSYYINTFIAEQHLTGLD